MKLIKVTCTACGKEYFRPVGRVNEARKFGWRQYCSIECQAKAKLRRIEKICGNPNCKKRVSRTQSQFKKSKSGMIFCSSSCAATFNNSLRRKIKTCPICGKQFYGKRKYCSDVCRFKAINSNKKSEDQKQEEILEEIKSFVNTHDRIPLKKEKPGLAWRAQKIFGSWNRAIELAGFNPNPVIFSKKFIAKDGHICNSLAEKIIDDWLFKRKIKHQRNVPYPEDKKLTADFVIKNCWIEYFGLSGEIKIYDKIIKRKRSLCKKYKLSLIEVYPKDLFPKNHLAKLLKI